MASTGTSPAAVTHAKSRVQVAPTPESAARLCAAHVVASARAALDARGGFTLALTGGSTPAATYRALAAEHARDVDWKRVHFFVGDERMVPYEDPRSNYGAARAAWLAGLGLPEACLHPMPVGPDGDEAARGYERELRSRAPD